MSADKEVKGCGRHYSTVSSRNRCSCNFAMGKWRSGGGVASITRKNMLD